MVYFIEAVGLDLIKIGFTTDLKTRFYDLQQMSPAPLRIVKVIARGTRRSEGVLHRRLRAHLVRGEWFVYSAVQSAIEAISEDNIPQLQTCCDCGRPLKRNVYTRCKVCAGKRRDVSARTQAAVLKKCADCGAQLQRKSPYVPSGRCKPCGMRAAWAAPAYREASLKNRAARRRACALCGESEPRVKRKYHQHCWQKKMGLT